MVQHRNLTLAHLHHPMGSSVVGALGLTDNNTNAYLVENATGGANYIRIVTTTSANLMEFGNTTTNPGFTFLGSGTLRVSDGTINLDSRISGASGVTGTSTAHPFVIISNGTTRATWTSLGVVTFAITFNIAAALTISESTNNYIVIATTTGSEAITFGNVTTDPDFSFIGDGFVSVDPSNTSTQASFLINQSGTGDAAMRWRCDGVDVQLGVDNSDSNRWVMSESTVLGTTNRLAIAPAGGRITFFGGMLVHQTVTATLDTSVYQQSGFVQTINATATTILTLTVDIADSAGWVEVYAAGIRQTVADSAAYCILGRFENTVNVVVISPASGSVDFASEDNAAWNVTINGSSNGTIVIQVVGVTDQTINWTATARWGYVRQP